MSRSTTQTNRLKTSNKTNIWTHHTETKTSKHLHTSLPYWPLSNDLVLQFSFLWVWLCTCNWQMKKLMHFRPQYYLLEWLKSNFPCISVSYLSTNLSLHSSSYHWLLNWHVDIKNFFLPTFAHAFRSHCCCEEKSLFYTCIWSRGLSGQVKLMLFSIKLYGTNVWMQSFWINLCD